MDDVALRTRLHEKTRRAVVLQDQSWAYMNDGFDTAQFNIELQCKALRYMFETLLRCSILAVIEYMFSRVKKSAELHLQA